MKKAIGILLMAMVLFALAACGGGAAPPAPTPTHDTSGRAGNSGRTDELQAHLAVSRSALNDLREKVQESGATALFVMLWEDRMSIFLPEGRFHMIYDEFGFLSAAYDLPEWGDQHGFDARAEFILSVDPDVILLLDRTDMGSPTGGVGVQNFMADSIIQSTTAAQAGHIYVLQGNPWYTLLGGLGALDIMIANVMEFIHALE